MKIIPDFLRLNSGENLSRRLLIDVTEFSEGFTYKLSFITPLGKLYLTQELGFSDGRGEYYLPFVLLDGKGVLYCQLCVFGENGFVVKSEIYEFPVYSSCDTGSHPAADENEIKSFFDLFSLIDEKSDREHNHDGLYYLKSETERLLSGKSDASHTHSEYLKKEDMPEIPETPENISEFNNDAGYVTEAEMNEALSEKSDASHSHPHNHDERYYTKDNIDSMMEGSAESGHNHDSRYYTEEETDTLLSGKSDAAHTHSEYLKKEDMPKIPEIPENVSEFNNDAGYVTESKMNESLSKKSDVLHKHDGEYANKTDFDNLQLVVAANSSTVAEVQDECNALSGQLNGVEQKQNTQALSLQLICSSMEQMADIVVDEGTFGEWTYRKWESGIAECWGNIACNHSNAVGKGSNYRFAVDYPFMFAKTPLAFIHPSAMAYKVKKTYPLAPTDTNNKAKLTIFVLLEEDVAVGAGETNSFYVNVKGNWK